MRGIPFAAALGLCAALGGCAGSPALPASGSPRVEDAGPLGFVDREVDVPARPVEPLRPDYPPRLRALGLEGDVAARVAVLADGSVGGARLVEGSHDDFVAATREALREARFQPARRDGRPVASWVTLRVRFRLDAEP